MFVVQNTPVYCVQQPLEGHQGCIGDGDLWPLLTAGRVGAAERCHELLDGLQECCSKMQSMHTQALD